MRLLTLLDFGSELALPEIKGVQAFKVSALGEIRDSATTIAELYGASMGDMFLVRPDGYIGAVVDAENRDALLRWMHLNFQSST